VTVPRLVIALGLVGTSLLVVAAPAQAGGCTGANAQTARLSTGQLESAVVCLINEEREAANQRPVRSNGSLHQAGLAHSEEMVSEGYFEHTSPAGVSFIDRILATPYLRGARRWLLGENLIWGRGSASSARRLVQGWMESPPHRANLLRGRFREVGIGAVRGTPSDASDSSAVTVSAEFGFRQRGATGSRRHR
jgi:uncharacterized protein YkwD